MGTQNKRKGITTVIWESRLEVEQSGLMGVHGQYIGNNIVLCNVLGRFMIYVDARDISIAPHLMMRGLWESWITFAIQRHIKKGMNCIDIGANVGYYTVVMAACGANVIAIEPNPKLKTLLENTISINGIGHRVKGYGWCITDKSDDMVKLYVPIANNGAASMMYQPPKSEYTLVNTITLDDMISDRVDFIKCDVEGAEPLVWKGMQRVWKENQQLEICLESIGNIDNRSELYDLLSKDSNWIGMVNHAGNIIPVDRDVVINSEGVDMLWVRH